MTVKTGQPLNETALEPTRMIENPSSGSAPSDQAAAKAAAVHDRHLRTDHLLANLKQRTISSGVVTVLSQGLKFALTLGSTAVLARLLAPRDFGLVAMVGTITSFLRVLKDAGLSTATVQREGITHAQVSNLFWINLGISAGMGAVVAGLAPAIAWFYKEPKLVGLTLALSVTFLLSGSTIQHVALLNRQMRFKAIALIEVGAMVTGVLAGMSMAWLHCRYWSLVGMSMAQESAGIVLTWSVSRWRPQWPVRHCGTRSLLHFGANLTVANLIGCIAQNMDSLLLGRIYGAEAVGLYSRALALLMRPLSQLLTPITSVFEPTLARLQHEPERYRRMFLLAYNVTALIGFLATAFLLPLARPVTLILLGAHWEPVAVILAGFTGVAFYVPLITAACWLLISQGRGRDMLLASLFTGPLTIAAFAAGVPFGPAGVAIAWSLSGLLIGTPYIFWLVGWRGPIRTGDLWRGLFAHAPVWLVVAGVVFAARWWVRNTSPAVQMSVAVPAGLAAAAGIIRLWPASRKTAVATWETVYTSLRKRTAGANAS